MLELSRRKDKQAPIANLLKVSKPQMAQLQASFFFLEKKSSVEIMDIICQYYPWRSRKEANQNRRKIQKCNTFHLKEQIKFTINVMELGFKSCLFKLDSTVYQF